MGNLCVHPRVLTKKDHRIKPTTSKKWKRKLIWSSKKPRIPDHSFPPDEDIERISETNDEANTHSNCGDEEIVDFSSESVLNKSDSQEFHTEKLNCTNITLLPSPQDSPSFRTCISSTTINSPKVYISNSGNQSMAFSYKSLGTIPEDEVLQSLPSSSEIEENNSTKQLSSEDNMTPQFGRITPMPTPLRKFSALSPGREIEVFGNDGRPVYRNKGVVRYINDKRKNSC